MDTQTPAVNPQIQDQEDIVIKAKQNKNKIMGICAIIVALAIAAIAWFFVDKTSTAKANEIVGKADIEKFMVGAPDSVVLQKYIDAVDAGKAGGARAALEVAMIYYKEKNYEEAISYLKKHSVGSSIFEAGRLSLMGDCYVNLGKYEEALSSFGKAYDAADKNPEIAPFILVKEANVYRELKEYNKEYTAYQTIINDYPVYVNRLSQNNVDIYKYMQRAKVAAGK